MRWLWPALVAGCVEGPGHTPVRLVGDREVFVAEVQPVLMQRCSNPSCHGAAGRPLEIYAPQRHRRDPDRVFVDEPLDEEEVQLNWLRACSFLVADDAPEACLLLRKPLDPAAGGVSHEGGVQLEGPDDPTYALLLDWIAEASPVDVGGTP